MTLRREVLAPSQRELWDHHLPRLPPEWVLYGGTSIALRTGHRQSVDFDFFSDAPLDEDRLRVALPILARSTVLHRDPASLDLVVPIGASGVKLSFYGGIGFGRVSTPEQTEHGVLLAGLLDLLAIKVKVLQQRVEARDYLDIDAILRAGFALSDGLRAAAALFPSQINPIDAAKAVAWFVDGDLERQLPAAVRQRLRAAVAEVDPAALAPLALEGRRLAGGD